MDQVNPMNLSDVLKQQEEQTKQQEIRANKLLEQIEVLLKDQWPGLPPTTLQEIRRYLNARLLHRMFEYRKVRGVRLKDGREELADDRHQYVMYDDGVQEEDDGGGTLWDWNEILEVLV